MIKSDYGIEQGRTTESWEVQLLSEYITLIGETRELIARTAGHYLAACTIIEQSKIPARLCADDARTHLADAMETVIDLQSLADDLEDKQQFLAHHLTV